MEKKKNLTLTLIALLTVILLTAGVTYAFFSYAKEGTTDNIITTGSITFLYTEVDGVGNGIQIENAFPMSDEVGKNLSKTNEYFDFKITSDTTNNSAIPYEVTARKNKDSDDIDEYIRVYLTKGETNEEVLLDNYSELTQTSKVDENKYTEKTIYNGNVPSNTDYEENFRLRMWIDQDTRFDNVDIHDKTFTLTVNVYANAKIVTEEEKKLESSTNIDKLSVGNNELTRVEEGDYDYEITLPEKTTSTTINVETENPNATVIIEKTNSLVKSNNVKRLSITKTLQLAGGNNYFKVTVISENKELEKEYKIRIKVDQGAISLNDAIFNKYNVIETTPNFKYTSAETGTNGLYKWVDSEDTTKISYYFRGNVDNSIEFAGQTWSVVRINEDGTVRIIMSNGINNNAGSDFNKAYKGYTYMYYSNNNIASYSKYLLDNWYQTNIVDKGYYDYVAVGEYFCEQAKVRYATSYGMGNASMATIANYTPTLKCETDGNQKGLVNSGIGTITFDEVAYAGGWYNKSNTSFYLNNGKNFWTMSPAGVATNNNAIVWYVTSSGVLNFNNGNRFTHRPVINLKIDTPVIMGDEGTTVWKVVEE